VLELRRAQRERDAWQRHAQQLARTLAAERRRRAGARRGGRGPIGRASARPPQQPSLPAPAPAPAPNNPGLPPPAPPHPTPPHPTPAPDAGATSSVSGGAGEQPVEQAQEEGAQQQEQQQSAPGAPDKQQQQQQPADGLDAAGEAEASALAQLPPDLAAAAANGAAAPPAGGGGGGALGAFEWPGSARGQLDALVAKGRASGWLVAPGEVELGPLLGAGAFGETHKGRWRGADVAVKRVRVGSDTELVSFLREVECLAGLRHPGVVPFLGAVLQVRKGTGGGGGGGGGRRRGR
jgi:hypothetical protein